MSTPLIGRVVVRLVKFDTKYALEFPTFNEDGVIWTLEIVFATEIILAICVVVPVPIVKAPVLASVTVGEVVVLPTYDIAVLVSVRLAPILKLELN